ncbi:pirin family protein [Oceanicaulis sp. UBA2681]|uniref:pirin family protein n=1 Tax=Oceanicaulis sp. UBA2681 TaxID=1947007 RepID=UPI0025803D55|nr:pirin family protein [Oceanicaulis sp. UBA2681]|tara:strand:- start:919 stop:1617 length:699 start_codon:yes stop_codon:yes gene_type:complete
MIDVRRFEDLGAFRFDWLNAKHHFSFGSYHNPKRMGWGALRVWNDDEIQPGTGFPPHPHAEMEIITYVRDGAITHQDSLGNKGRTVAGDVQVMSAGKGIRHAEYNRENELTRIFQIWIMPDERGGEPFWDSRSFPKNDRAGELIVLASGRKGDDDALPIRADARVLGGTLKSGQSASYALEPGRHAYLALAKGAAIVNGETLGPRDGAAIVDEPSLEIKAIEDAEIVLVDSL